MQRKNQKAVKKTTITGITVTTEWNASYMTHRTHSQPITWELLPKEKLHVKTLQEPKRMIFTSTIGFQLVTKELNQN
ncbi:Hypothetical predicted protein [Podarcis lilfordi]|uniref:Uncharacterized protein n=1 Tax=Podarcis lilfordi TaxID=74358 RepID=A0AA35KV25_9SAUR|nr:Hypothetical predicted protein [Podarcis lilfordi]